MEDGISMWETLTLAMHNLSVWDGREGTGAKRRGVGGAGRGAEAGLSRKEKQHLKGQDAWLQGEGP